MDAITLFSIDSSYANGMIDCVNDRLRCDRSIALSRCSYLIEHARIAKTSSSAAFVFASALPAANGSPPLLLSLIHI